MFFTCLTVPNTQPHGAPVPGESKDATNTHKGSAHSLLEGRGMKLHCFGVSTGAERGTDLDNCFGSEACRGAAGHVAGVRLI